MEMNCQDYPKHKAQDILNIVRSALLKSGVELGDDEWFNSHELVLHYTYCGLKGYVNIVGDADWEHGVVNYWDDENPGPDGETSGVSVRGTVYYIGAYILSLKEDDLSYTLPDGFFFRELMK